MREDHFTHLLACRNSKSIRTIDVLRARAFDVYSKTELMCANASVVLGNRLDQAIDAIVDSGSLVGRVSFLELTTLTDKDKQHTAFTLARDMSENCTEILRRKITWKYAVEGYNATDTPTIFVVDMGPNSKEMAQVIIDIRPTSGWRKWWAVNVLAVRGRQSWLRKLWCPSVEKFGSLVEINSWNVDDEIHRAH